ncbi:MAG: hypothetical protein WCT18_00690 [Patescibacteria group bacterium]
MNHSFFVFPSVVAFCMFFAILGVVDNERKDEIGKSEWSKKIEILEQENKRAKEENGYYFNFCQQRRSAVELLGDKKVLEDCCRCEVIVDMSTGEKINNCTYKVVRFQEVK